MKKNLIYLFTVLVLCSCKQSNTNEGSLPRLTVSILPQKYFVQKIAGEGFLIDVLVSPGASHETYDPTPRQMLNVGKSSIYFLNGYLSFEETWKKNFADNNPNLRFAEISKGITVIKGDHEHHDGQCSASGDPHYWLSPACVKIMAANIRDELSVVYPDQKEFFSGNFEKFVREIDSVDLFAKSHLQNLKTNKFLIFHPALTYFANDYGLEQIAIEVDGKTPTAKGMGIFIDLARSQNIRVVMMQSQFDTQNAKAIADEIDGRIVQFDPMSGDWKNNMESIILTLKEALSQ